MARKILLADDSVTAQNMGRKILTDAGYEVSTVNNGSAALKKIAELKPDLIVLDVYMPGYSGLEVCQRIKEARETARIPVLLTVGKLEPFKPEEARRARADGFIIKPFEASELLVALTKLEDKIVPQPESYKPGRFAKAIAAVEQFKNGETGEDFGDAESGWKNRIQFPSATPKALEPEPEIEIPPAGKKGFRDFFRSERKPRKAEPEFDRPMPAGVPPDITSEEIAAIAAAAAKVNASGQATEPASTPTPPPPVEARIETPADLKTTPPIAATSDPVPVAAPEEAPPVTFASAVQIREDKAEVPEVKNETTVPTASTSAQSAPAEPQAPSPAVAKAPEPEPSDAEVMAALQSLDRQDSSPSKSDVAVTTPAAKELVAAASVSPSVSGPRWIAESVAVSAAESALRLEEEMEKAHATLASTGLATFAASSSGTPAAHSGRPQETAMSAIVEEHATSAGPASVPVSEPVSKSGPEATPATPVEAAKEVEPAKAESLESPEPAKEKETGTAPSQDRTDSPATDTSSAEPASASPAMAEPAAAFVAAESATSALPQETAAPAPIANEVTAPEPPPAVAVGEAPTAPAPASAAPEGDQEVAKTAAAWANWHQIHETAAPATVQVADQPAAPGVETNQEARADSEVSNASSVEKEALAAAAAAAAGAGSDSSNASSDSNIASIVEGVLAELRPKLVEEIARKLKK